LISNKLNYLNEIFSATKINLKSVPFKMIENKAIGTQFVLQVAENTY
jgi:hypothetical protein